MAVGADGALTGGVNRLPPVGLIAFSTGAGACGGGAGAAGGAAVSVTVFVTVTFSGAGASRAQAESTSIAMIAPMPAVATRRRPIRPDLMMRPICIVHLNYIVQKFPRQRVDRRMRHALSGVGPCLRQTPQSNCPELSRAGSDWQEAQSFFPLSFQLAIRRWHQGARRAVQPKRLSAGARGN